MGMYFEPLLFMALIASLIIALIDLIFFEKHRRLKAMAADPDFITLSRKEKKERMKPPMLAEYARELFPIFLIVFLLRSFVAEPFIVPSGSMLPTIQLDEFLLINKFAYGLRPPFLGTPVIKIGAVERGDILVFRDPVNPQTDFIKRVIGLPGDHISYLDKQLYVNGVKVPTEAVGTIVEPNNANLQGGTLVNDTIETLGSHTYHAYNSPNAPTYNFKNLVVPPDSYFAMGDNRDNSEDSRFWGFVPDRNVVGKASLIFFSWDNVHNSVRFARIGHFLP